MSQRFVAKKKRTDSYIPNPDDLRKSILELRQIYREMSDMDFCVWYENRYGVKWKDVQSYLGRDDNEN